MSTTEVPVPEGMTAEGVRRLVQHVAASRSAVARVSSLMEQQEAEIGPATSAQLASVEHLWRHLLDRYGIYDAADIATLRGAKPGSRSVATNLAKRDGLIGFMRGRSKVYPTFQFKGRGVHPNWRAVSAPLVEAGWDDEDILLWMVSPNAALDGREPAALIDEGDAGPLRAVVAREALGVW